jgi:isoquinoline 1-oxidoreductase beta subunit
MKRRRFLHAATLAATGLVLGFHAQGGDVVVSKAAADGGAPLGDFLRITPDGTVLFRLVKHEMGQGIATSLAQIACEELCADWTKVEIELSDADLERFQNAAHGGHETGGSATVATQYDVMRKAGALARQMLESAAAKVWGVSPDQCWAENHRVVHRRSSRALMFGELATAAAQLPIPAQVQLKPERAFTLIGQPKVGKLSPAIVSGRLKYGIDVQLPGMLYAVIARCPVFEGKLARFDAAEALKIPGVKHVFSTEPIAGPRSAGFPHDIRAGVAVVANSFWAAKRGRQALKIEWHEGPNARYDTEHFERWARERATRRGDPTGYVGNPNAIADMGSVRKTLHASYVYPHQLHSCMEPLNCTAHVRGDDVRVNDCEIWCGSQAPNLIIAEIGKLLGLPPAAIRVHLMPSGGGFGRRYYPDFAVEAAYVSMQAGRQPVKMLWTREDDPGDRRRARLRLGPSSLNSFATNARSGIPNADTSTRRQPRGAYSTGRDGGWRGARRPYQLGPLAPWRRGAQPSRQGRGALLVCEGEARPQNLLARHLGSERTHRTPRTRARQRATGSGLSA